MYRESCMSIYLFNEMRPQNKSWITSVVIKLSDNLITSKLVKDE